MNSSFLLEIIKASEIEPKEVKWLWYPYIPFGKVTLLQGDPDDGKSKFMKCRKRNQTALQKPICIHQFKKFAHTAWPSLTTGQRNRFPLIFVKC